MSTGGNSEDPPKMEEHNNNNNNVGSLNQEQPPTNVIVERNMNEQKNNEPKNGEEKKSEEKKMDETKKEQGMKNVEKKMEETKKEQEMKNVEKKMDETKKEQEMKNVEKKDEPEKVEEKKKDELEKEEEKKNEENKDELKEEAECSKTKEVMEMTEEKKVDGATTTDASAATANGIERSSSFKEESNLPSDLREFEKKALVSLRSKVEEAILGNKILDYKEKDHEMSLAKVVEMKMKEEKEKEKLKEGKPLEEGGEKNEEQKELPQEGEKKEESVSMEGNEAAKKEDKTKEIVVVEGEKGVDVVDKDIAIWGVPLLSSKGDKRTDVILLKFLRAREFKVNDAFDMLRATLQWRKKSNIDSILGEDFEADFGSTAFMEGSDREGHPVCYNIFGALSNDELYGKTLGNDEKREKFLRWRIQLMEKGIQKLDLQPDGVSTMLQINDLKNTPLPTKKEVRNATKKAVELLQDNYPEFVAKNIFINVPFWYYAFSAVLSPFLTQRTKNKFVYARSGKVIDTLLRYIAAEEIHVQYGGLKREDDSDFSGNDTAKESIVKSGATETIEIPAPEEGSTLIWDLTVCGWEVNYKEEFVPTDDGSYTVIVQKGRKISWQEGSIRNSYRNNEPGKIVITIDNATFKKKRIFYRYKQKNESSSSS